MVTFVKENSKMEIIYSKMSDYLGPVDPDALTILGAAYGPSDATKEVWVLLITLPIPCILKLKMMCLVMIHWFT